ncbi:sugar isomerase [Erythrobacter sp. QSSC1-22B]|uniref:L-rhamnose isomerase n=1 Tax=Erythrobacter sp. QSSC1-22B TaxID=1860125 RepID=UPI0008055601|nr:L-rhamnose isomerase [Erythrobacter sp. QSSC1-22B]OBX17944.1 sugar isomerase [Erythrobacter sp. QSSC1-22B]
MNNAISEAISRTNASAAADHEVRLDGLRKFVDVNDTIDKLAAFEVAVPTWGVGTGGTRFARFPIPGEPTSIFDKIDDCGVIQELVTCCPRVSPHFPWDDVRDYSELRDHATARNLGFDAVNSNTFQDQAKQQHSYRHGSLTHSEAAVRDQAIAHNIDCIEVGKALGSSALTVWIGDGSNYPGQSDMARSFDRYLNSAREIYAALPDDWTMLIEHKLFEPAFYSTVIQDWGSSYLAATAMGPKAACLVDLGHHAPSVNIEMIVARLAWAGKLGGFHFNDSKYGDDDLDSGSIQPFQLFLVFNELVEASARASGKDTVPFAPAYMLDQSHNVTDPIESLAVSADALQCACARALLVDRASLHEAQDANDVITARALLQDAYQTDVRPLVAETRRRRGGAIDPIAAYRASGYRNEVAKTRKLVAVGSTGIV